MAKLYVVGTPIGNLGDFSPRGAKTLEMVDFIAAEDTRVSIKLLNHLGIKKQMVSYHEHNIRERGEYILQRIAAGESCAIITDAGMPCISDPGEDIVALCHEQGVEIEVVPGPSALIAALAISGLLTSRFVFEGFLSVKKPSRRKALENLRGEERTIILYEAPHKLKKTLDDLLEWMGDRRISIVRELTKIHEEVNLTTLSQAVAYYKEKDPRGEFVLVLEGAAPLVEETITFEEAVAETATLAKEVGSSQATKEISAKTGFRKAELYKALQNYLK